MRHLDSISGSALLLTLLAVGSGPVAAQDSSSDPAAVMTAAAERYGQIGTVCAQFVQQLNVPLLGSNQESRGTLCQRQPNLFAMDFRQPEGDRIVADGQHFWIYFRSQNPDQVIQLPVDPSRGGMDFYREFLDEPLQKYSMKLEGREPVGGTPTVRIQLTPRMNRGYQGATVWIDPASDLIRKVEIVESNGTVRTLTLSDVRVDPTINDQTFRFTVPAGVQVISTGGLR